MLADRLLPLILEELKKRGLSMRAASLQAGLKQDAIRNIHRGKSKQPRIETLLALARFLQLEIPIDEQDGKYPQPTLETLIDPKVHIPNADITDSRYVPPMRSLERDVPVYGITVGGNGGSFHWNGEVVDMVRRPQGLKDATLFALYVSGDSMEPRYERGDLVFVTRAREPIPGNDVVVELVPEQGQQNGACYVKRLVRRTTTKIVLREYNPPGEFEIPIERVKAILRVVRPSEMHGSG